MHNFIKIVVAGDVDSGKSTLIGRYLYESGSLCQGVMDDIAEVCKNLDRNFEFAYLLDSFKEERKNQLTIDTTQSFCKSKKGNHIVFIDVPGHQELLKNMISGASYADIAILLIDINKSVKDQTKRHAFILKLLGIFKIVIAINKMDSVNFNKIVFLKTRQQISKVFKNFGLEFNECIPISAKNGDNLLSRSKGVLWYKGKPLSLVLDGVKIKKDNDFRFLVQDIFKDRKGKIAIGQIISGDIKNGSSISILPLQKNTYVKSMKYFDRNIQNAKAPLAVGIILENMDGIKRGQILSSGQPPIVTNTILGKIICTGPISLNSNLILRSTVQQTKVKIDKIKYIYDNDVAEVILKTKDNLVVEKYKGYNSLGRFVLTNKQEKIVAVGTVS